MSAIDTFLASRLAADTLAAMDTATKARVARALDMPVAVATVALVSYTPERAKTGTGQFLSVAVEGSRNGVFLRLCDGATLTADGQAKARTALGAIIEAASATLATLA